MLQIPSAACRCNTHLDDPQIRFCEFGRQQHSLAWHDALNRGPLPLNRNREAVTSPPSSRTELSATIPRRSARREKRKEEGRGMPTWTEYAFGVVATRPPCAATLRQRSVNPASACSTLWREKKGACPWQGLRETKLQQPVVHDRAGSGRSGHLVVQGGAAKRRTDRCSSRRTGGEDCDESVLAW